MLTDKNLAYVHVDAMLTILKLYCFTRKLTTILLSYRKCYETMKMKCVVSVNIGESTV